MTSQNRKDNHPPVEKIRFGGVLVSVYANEIKDSSIPLYKVTISRTYVDKGEFKTATSFRHEDIPYLNHVLLEAWKQIGDMKQQAWDASRSDASEPASDSTETKD